MSSSSRSEAPPRAASGARAAKPRKSAGRKVTTRTSAPSSERVRRRPNPLESELAQAREALQRAEAEAEGHRADLRQQRSELEMYRAWTRRIAAVCEDAANGNLESRLLEIDVGGAFGAALHGINQLLDLTDAFVRESGASLEHASRDQFYRKVLTHGLRGSFGRGASIINLATEAMRQKSEALDRAATLRQSLADAFEDAVRVAVDSVASHSVQLERTAEILSHAASEASCRSETAQNAARAASNSVDSIATATEQLTASVGEIGRQAQSSADASRDAVEAADQTGETVGSLTHATQHIGRVVSLIQHIAGQTNLLALNATIEAARAGHAGKGFAVVASEVKLLSNQTSEAAGSIGCDVEDIQTAASGVVAAIDTIGSTIQQMNAIAGTIYRGVQEQGAVTQEISRSAQDAARGARGASENVEAMSRSVASTTAAAAELLHSARALRSMSETLRSEVDEFVGQIRQG